MTGRFVRSSESGIVTPESYSQLIHPKDAAMVLNSAWAKDSETGEPYGGCVTYGPTVEENSLMINSIAWIATRVHSKNVNILSLDPDDLSSEDVEAVIAEAQAPCRDTVLVVNNIDVLGIADETEDPELSHAKARIASYIGFAIRKSEKPTIVGVAVTPRTESFELSKSGKRRPTNPILRAFPQYWAYTPHVTFPELPADSAETIYV